MPSYLHINRAVKRARATPMICTWIKVEENVDEILISPGDVVSVSLVVGDHLFDPATFAHTTQVHQHHTRVDS